MPELNVSTLPMNPLYNAGIHLYSAAARAASLKSDKVRRMLRGQRDTAARLAAFRRDLAPDGFDVWFHASSLGEFEQARPLVDRLLAERPGCRILVSFFSPSGYEVRHSYDPRVAVVYLPFDTPAGVRSFLDAARPRMAIFVKYEFWGNYLSELRRRSIPTYIISSIFRPGQIFFRPWGGMFRRILRCFDHLYVQDEASRKLLEGIGIDNVTVAGDTRFDRVWTVTSQPRPLPEFDRFASDSRSAGARMLVVGSSWQPDEDIYIPRLLASPGWRAIIAPHEFDGQRLEQLLRRFPAGEAMLLSQYRRAIGTGEDTAGVKYIIVDCFGLLSSIYRYADVAYIGGGFGTGIHNINEAAAHSVGVVFGPRHYKFKEATDLQECGGGFCIHSESDFNTLFDTFDSQPGRLADAGKAAGNYIRTHIGASGIILHDLFHLDPQPKS